METFLQFLEEKFLNPGFKQYVLEEEMKYPVAPKGTWYSDEDYEKTGGKMIHLSPQEYLDKVRPLDIDDSSRDNIDYLKQHIKSGRHLDPVKIYHDGKEDGRHRAHAAKELGIKKIPVIVWKPDNKK